MKLSEPVGDTKLSIQKEQVAQMLGTGHKVAEAAKHFSISKKTVYAWLSQDKDFSDRVIEIGTDAVRAGVAWAADRYQSYLGKVEEIAFDETKSARDRLSALEMLLKRAEKAREDGIQQQIHQLQKAVFGESAIDVLAEEIVDSQMPEQEEQEEEENFQLTDPAKPNSQAAPQESRDSEGNFI